MNLIALTLLAVGGIILTIGDLFMKKWVVTSRPGIYFIGMIFYIIGANCLAFSFKYKNIAIASVIYILFNIATLLIVSYFYFKEKLTGLEIAGMIFGLIAIVLLELADK